MLLVLKGLVAQQIFQKDCLKDVLAVGLIFQITMQMRRTVSA